MPRVVYVAAIPQAKVTQELKDQLSKEKIRFMEQTAAMERELREKAVMYKEERCVGVSLERARSQECLETCD